MITAGYPLIYCPPGVTKPSHCPHLGAVPIARAGAGPDGKAGSTWGGGYRPESKAEWTKTSQGWWINLAGRVPQHLVRLDPSPRLIVTHLVQGAQPDHWWQIPALITPVDPKRRKRGYRSALDRVWMRDGYGSDPFLEALQLQLLAIVHNVPLARTPKARNAKLRRLIIDLAGLMHHVSEEEIIIGKWGTESWQQRVIFAAVDRPEMAATIGAERDDEGSDGPGN